MKKILFSLSILVFTIYMTSETIRELSYSFVDYYFYDGPPKYTNNSFKHTDPNKVCNYLSDYELRAGSYKRKTYTEYFCKTINKVSVKSNFSNQFFAYGDKYNINKMELHFKIFKSNSKKEVYEKLLEEINYILVENGLEVLTNTQKNLIRTEIPQHFDLNGLFLSYNVDKEKENIIVTIE